MTLPVVDALSTTGTMIVLGFRQFLLEPTTNSATSSNNPADGNGRFAAMYLGTVAPVKAGARRRSLRRHQRPGQGGPAPVRRSSRRGSMILEAAMIIPILVLLLVGMVQIAKITYVYVALRKTVYSIASLRSARSRASTSAMEPTRISPRLSASASPAQPTTRSLSLSPA